MHFSVRHLAHVQIYMSYLGFTLLKPLKVSSHVVVFFSLWNKLFDSGHLLDLYPNTRVMLLHHWFPSAQGQQCVERCHQYPATLLTANCINSTTQSHQEKTMLAAAAVLTLIYFIVKKQN